MSDHTTRPKNNFLHEAGKECGDYTSVLPWMEDGEMHMGCEQILAALHLRFMLVSFADVVPAAGPTCSCGCQVPCAGSLPMPWERLAHRHMCPDLAGLRTVVHDNVEGVLIDFLTDAGMIDVHFEDWEWDTDAAGSDNPADDDDRRPDIVCTHPLTGMRYVFDNTIAWRALSSRGVGVRYGTTNCGRSYGLLYQNPRVLYYRSTYHYRAREYWYCTVFISDTC
jgi:hypothetical protein